MFRAVRNFGEFLGTNSNKINLDLATAFFRATAIGLVIFDSDASAAVGMNPQAVELIGSHFGLGDSLTKLEQLIGCNPGQLKSTSRANRPLRFVDENEKVRIIYAVREEISLSNIRTFAVLIFDLDSVVVA